MAKSSDKKRRHDDDSDSAASKKQKVKDLDTPKKTKKVANSESAEPVSEKKSKKSKKATKEEVEEPVTEKKSKKSSKKKAATPSSSSESESSESEEEAPAAPAAPAHPPTPSLNPTLSLLPKPPAMRLPLPPPAPPPKFPSRQSSRALAATRFSAHTLPPPSPSFLSTPRLCLCAQRSTPVGFDSPADAACKQLLTPMVGKYHSVFQGILLNYNNVVVAERASRKGATKENDVAVKVKSRDEFAVGFGWVTADCDLFVPAVGSWLEGEIVLQTEGHVGVVCWGKFNASIERSRLPRDWRWIAAEEADMDAAGDMELDGAAAPAQTGYWADEEGTRVDGKLLFRIKRFDVGVRDDHSFISLEGSMLSDDAEADIRGTELAREMAKRNRASGYLMGRVKRVDDFAVTDCGSQEEEIRDIRSQIDWKRARPPTPTSYSMT